MKILVVEDEIDLNSVITRHLKKNVYSVDSAFNGEEAMDFTAVAHYDLIVLDLMMPVMDGYSLVKALRETKHTLPILMITAKSQLESLEEAFTLGVDDYMVKPIRLEELALRVRALLRRSQLETEKVLRFPHTKLDYNALTLTDLETDTVYQIPKKEFYVLYKLLSNPEKIFTRLDLLDDIWGMEEDLDERLVDACIKRVRQKFKDNPDFDIVTIRGLGYKGTVKNG